MKILIFQPENVRNYPSFTRLSFNRKLFKFLNPFIKLNNYYLNKIIYKITHPLEFTITSEFNHYGEIVNILGKDNVYSIERYHQSYSTFEPESFSKYIKWENYPSNFGYPTPQFISKSKIAINLHKFDAILASINCGKDIRKYLRLAKSKNVKVFLFDNFDHPEIYTDNNQDIFRGFKSNEFDFFFKKDIPLNNYDYRLFPIAPVPIKSETLISVKMDNTNQCNNIDLFFIGACHSRTRSDRLEILNNLAKDFKNSLIRINADKVSKDEYEKIAASSKILISPVGIIWCSYRHTEFAKYKKPVILPVPNCKTVNNYFIDGVNCILYKTEFRNNQWVISDYNELVDKINFYLSNPIKANEMGQNYYEMINDFHTTRKRSEYIINTIKSNL